MFPLSFLKTVTFLYLFCTVLCLDYDTLFRELIINNDYRLLEYSVPTNDGYLLSLHRVVPADFVEAQYSFGRKPLLFQHGLTGSSNNIFLNGDAFHSNYSDAECGNNFGFCLLATRRYDLWLANTRANGLSRGKTQNYKKHYYYAYSFQHMAKYDLPAIIDFIRQTTGHSKISYLGHSQGTISMFAMLVSDYGHKYHDVIRPFVAWGPPVYIYNMMSKAVLFRRLEPLLDAPIEVSITGLGRTLIEMFCEHAPDAEQILCPDFINEVYGKTVSTDFRRLPEWLKYVPSSTSSWSVLHFIQMYDSKEFQHFDYGPYYNRKHYNQSTPPKYKLSHFPDQVPVMIYNGVSDGFIPMENAHRLRNEIDPERTHSELTELSADGYWNHLDYLFSSKAGALLYKPTIEYLNKHYYD